MSECKYSDSGQHECKHCDAVYSSHEPEKAPCGCEYVTGAQRMIRHRDGCSTPPPASEPGTGHWYAGEDIDRLVREMDVWLNGEEGAAKQAKLCDVVAQITRRTQPPGVRCACGAHAWPADCIQIEDSRGRLHTQRGCQPASRPTKGEGHAD